MVAVPVKEGITHYGYFRRNRRSQKAGKGPPNSRIDPSTAAVLAGKG